MLRGYSFRPRGWALAVTAAACAAFVLLGNWQARRAEAKRALGAELERSLKSPPADLSTVIVAGSLIHKRVLARGRFVAERTVLLDNKLRRGRPGYEVVTPLALAGSEWHVLVNRGWIAAPTSRETLPDVRTPSGELTVVGIALERLPHALQAGSPSTGPVRQNLDIGAFAAETRLRPRPLAGPLVALRGKWVFLTVDAAACAAACERKLYVVRQVRRGQGKDAERIERLWLLTDGGKPRAELLAAIEGSHLAAADAELLKSLPGNAPEYIYLVDPLGNLMMRFPGDPDPSRLIKDLQRLMKYSRFG